MTKALSIVAALAAGGIATYRRRRQIELSEAYRRCYAALHVLRGRPIVWRVQVVPPPPPPLLHIAPECDNVLIAESRFSVAHPNLFRA